MASRFGVATNIWGSTSTWSATDGGAAGASVPGTGDNAFLTATSGAITVTISGFALGNGLDCNGFTGTLTHNAGQNCQLGGGAGAASDRALRLVAGMTYNLGSSTSTFTFDSISGSIQTIQTSGKTLGRMNFTNTATHRLSDANTCSGSVTLTKGGFNTNGQVCNWLSFASSNANTRALTLGASVITLTDTAATTVWNCATNTGLTVTANTSEIIISGVSSNTRTFAGGDKTYNKLTYTEDNSPGTLAITGANTFATLTVSDATGPKTLTLPSSATTTISTAFNVNGAAGRQVSLSSSTPGTPATLSKASGTVIIDYVTLTDITATGGANFVAGSHCIDGGGNTGWNFNALHGATYSSLSQMERAYFVQKAGGAPPTESLNNIKRRYMSGFIGGGVSSRTPLNQLEKLWLAKILANAGVTVMNFASVENLWRLVVISISQTPSNFVNDNKIKFYTNAI